MNITDLIVEMLEKGQKVEIPGIGTLDSVMQNAHHDPKTSTYYPASRTIAFSEESTGDTGIVKELAERECISEDVAKQMWLNYVDALVDKLKRSGRHTFGRLGTLTGDGKKNFSFKMTEGLVLDAGNKGEVPIEEVKIYSHEGEEDPFAQFDVEPVSVEPVAAAEPEPVAVAEPEPQPVAEPESQPAVEPEPVPEPAPEPAVSDEWKDELKQLDEITKSKEEEEKAARDAEKAERERIKAEKKAEEERIRLEKKAEEERKRAEELIAKEKAAAEKREAEEKRRAEEELKKAEKRAEEERRKAEKLAEHSRQKAEKEAEKERIKAEKKAAALAAVAAREQAKADLMAQGKAEKEAAIQAAVAEKQRKEAEKEIAKREKEAKKKAEAQAIAEEKARKQAEKDRAKAAKEAEKQAKKNKELADELMPITPAATTEDKGDDKGKKRKAWPIVLILILLLGLGAGAYMLLNGKGTPSGNEVASTDTGRKHLQDVGNTNSLTYNTDMLTYGQRDIVRNSDMTCRFMAEYINTYLSDRNYSNARVPMMDRVRQYSNDRMTELMGDRYAVQRLIPYNDYVYKYNEKWMASVYASRVRHTVQGELMNYRALDDILYRMVDELGLQPDAAGKKTAAEVQQVKETEKKATSKKATAKQPTDAPVYVYVEKGSKQGYDLIAGFYLNKATAAKQTARLHEMGCDAYIIEFNDLYYVSMGSASSQTSADALLKHIKSWYDGDVVIKKW